MPATGIVPAPSSPQPGNSPPARRNPRSSSRPARNTTANIDSDFDRTLGKTKVAPPAGKLFNPDADPVPTRQAQLQIPSHAVLQRHREPEAMSETSSAGPSRLCGGGLPGPGTAPFLHGKPSVSMNTVPPNPNTRSPQSRQAQPQYQALLVVITTPGSFFRLTWYWRGTRGLRLCVVNL